MGQPAEKRKHRSSIEASRKNMSPQDIRVAKVKRCKTRQSKIKEERRLKAQARQELRDKRSPQEQLDLLDKRGVIAKKERERLLQQIN